MTYYTTARGAKVFAAGVDELRRHRRVAGRLEAHGEPVGPPGAAVRRIASPCYRLRPQLRSSGGGCSDEGSTHVPCEAGTTGSGLVRGGSHVRGGYGRSAAMGPGSCRHEPRSRPPSPRPDGRSTRATCTARAPEPEPSHGAVSPSVWRRRSMTDGYVNAIASGDTVYFGGAFGYAEPPHGWRRSRRRSHRRPRPDHFGRPAWTRRGGCF